MKVLAVTGSSGGHIFPAISFIEALKERDGRIISKLVLPLRSRDFYELPKDCSAAYICSPKFSLKIDAKNFIALVELCKSFFQGLKIILEFKPDIVVGFGSLDSVPLLLLAWLFRIKTLIHEQNVLPGRANRLLAKFADKVAISFEQSRDHLAIIPEKISLTGNPLRKDIIRVDRSIAREFFGLDKDKFTVLVTGGSQGSRRINLAFSDALMSLLDSADFQVIHICGNSDYESLSKLYGRLGSRVKLMPFLDKMQYAYSAADLAVTRAGATTIAELVFFNLPAIIIPYPFAYAHQYSNARILQDENRGVIINDAELDTPKLKGLLAALISDPDKLGSLRSNQGQVLGKSAAELLVELALSLNYNFANLSELNEV